MIRKIIARSRKSVGITTPDIADWERINRVVLLS